MIVITNVWPTSFPPQFVWLQKKLKSVVARRGISISMEDAGNSHLSILIMLGRKL